MITSSLIQNLEAVVFYTYKEAGLLNIMLHSELQVGNQRREILEYLEMRWE